MAAAPVSWLVSINEEVKCYWARKNASKSVRKETPVHADWNLFAVKQLTKRTYDTYDSALQKKV